jgi:hypothetical protein
MGGDYESSALAQWYKAACMYSSGLLAGCFSMVAVARAFPSQPRNLKAAHGVLLLLWLVKVMFR